MKRFKNILLYVGTEHNTAAINRAIHLAMENEAILTLMDVVKPVPKGLGILVETHASTELEAQIAKDHRQELLRMASEYSDTGVAIDAIVSVGDPAQEIVRQVLANQHDLVMKTADGLSASGRIFGSVGRSLLRICPCPVWLLKPEIHGEFDRVLAAVDVDAEDEGHIELNRKILKLAHSVAQRENAELHVVGAWDLWMETSLRRRAGDKATDAELARHESRANQSLNELLHVDYAKPNEFHRHLKCGPAASVIRTIADKIEADLLVMGTVCRTGVAGFLIGNTAETVLSDIGCSVLAVKPHGFVSPVEFVQSVEKPKLQRQVAQN